ncbi:hypothetical protein K440DRAFT_659625 [Wilcoxina mikolae CBS 423.85]|nr:hypothetical protein K440DRAFT_659625 [Wilcoxina mikolae CBS 423.85]
MVEKANSTKHLASAEKSKKPSKSTPSIAKSTERVQESDMESDSEDERESGSEETGGEGEKEARVTIYKYQPPENFTPLLSDSLSNRNPFSAANLSGKELWLITAPVGAPLTKIHSINPTDIAEGNPVLETKSGRSYCLKPNGDVEEEGAVIMVPNSEGVYRAAGKPIARSFRLVESLPKPKKISEEDVPAANPVRLQPEGLHMRYRPFGAVDDGKGDGMAATDAMDIDEEVPHAEEGSPERKKKRHKSSLEKDKKKKHKSKGKEVEA